MSPIPTRLRGLPTEVGDHELAIDRGPYDNPFHRDTWHWHWHWRWTCSCGAEGNWQPTSAEESHRTWYRHVTERGLR